EDSWTVYTADGKKSAQWEHTILVTATGCEILTLRSEESLPRILNNA
ncbi:TPA: type I methionyl aminopeptidase, partial [Vibrio cholerae]